VVVADVGTGRRVRVCNEHAVVRGPSKFADQQRVFQFTPFCVIGGDPQDYTFFFSAATRRTARGHANIFRRHVDHQPGTAKGGGVTRGIGMIIFFLCAFARRARLPDRHHTLFVNGATTLAGSRWGVPVQIS